MPPEEEGKGKESTSTEAKTDQDKESGKVELKETPKENGEDKGAAKEIDLSGIESRLEELESTNTELQAVNAILRRELEGKKRREGEEEEGPRPPSREELTASLRTDPVGTIQQMIENAVSSVEKKASSAVDERTTQQQQINADIEHTQAEFPELRTDPAFFKEASKIYNALIESQGVFPGAQYLAASTAYARMLKQGKIKVKSEERKGIKETVRSAPDAMLGEPPPVSENVSEFDRMGYNEEDLSKIEKHCKKMGISVDAFKKQVMELKKGNAWYGTGR